MSLVPSHPSYASPSSTSLVAPSLAGLYDTPLTQKQVDASVQDYFLMEAVHTFRHSSEVARERLKKREEEMVENGLLPQGYIVGGSAGGKGAGSKAQVTEEEDAIRIRLESMGAHAGANLAERLVGERGRFTDTLDVIKFICKDVWMAVWEKQIDNLRTNHRGVYVLQDNTFRPIVRISSSEGPVDALKRAKIHTAFPAGLLRGALSRLGYQATVVAEITSLPQCTFQIKLPKGT
ncbi:TRAPP complex subunit trs33 [Hysterangium stoloniferum]|nr:TRAPP complex subunit trs33 [Hysterangium stoloniferum]